MGMIMHDDVPYGEGTSYTQGTGIAINNNVIAVDADNTPTAGSEKPVKSKGVHSALEANREESASLLKSTVGWTGKNKLHYDLESLKSNNTSGTWNNNVYTVNKTHFTVNDDLSISVTTDAEGVSADAVFDILDSNLAAGSYKASGCTNGSVSTYILLVYNDNYSGVNYVTDGDTDITLTGSTMRRVRMLVKSGQIHTTALLFEPMIRDASITDDTYEPYHESVEEEIEQIYADNGVLGAKNLIPNNATSQTFNGVTFTVNADGSVTANGTATSDSYIVLSDSNMEFDIAMRYILSGTPALTGLNLYIHHRNADNTAWIDAAHARNGGDVIFSPTVSGTRTQVVVWVTNGVTVNNLTFYPMLRLASDPDDTYVPYAMTNRELTEMVKRTKLLGTDDLDTVFGYGDYYWENAIPLHSPENQTFSSMHVYPCGEVTHQEVIRGSGSDAKIYLRRYQNSWSSWYKFTGTVVS